MKQLDSENRELLLSYYKMSGRKGSESRKRLAESMGLTTLALRLRVFRLRSKLENSVKVRLAELSS